MTKETEHKRIITERFGHQCDSDFSFTQKARLLQSIYRVEMGEKEGSAGPGIKTTDDTAYVRKERGKITAGQAAICPPTLQ